MADPAERIAAKAEELGVNAVYPYIGETVVIGQHYPKEKWWREMSRQYSQYAVGKDQ